MSMLLLLVISLTVFLAIEMRITSASADRQRAQLNATLALRMALAQLQQETGPDQRVTAQANLTLPVPSGEDKEARALWEERNPYWTLAWDTREKNQNRPPAALVSGEAQFNSLDQKSSYETKYEVPWKKISAGIPDFSEYVTLFSSARDTAADADEEMPPLDTRVTVKRVSLRDAARQINGHIGWWISDEGVKARMNLRDAFADEPPDSARGLARLTTPGRAAATELFPHWTGIKSGDPKLAQVLDTADYALIEGVPEGTLTTTYAHAVTAHSEGLLVDVRNGGLKHDLSIALELPYEKFQESPFGRRGTEPSTLNMDGTVQSGGGSGAGTVKNLRWEKEIMHLVSANKDVESRPVFSVNIGSGYKIRGPSWDLMRNYYQLYKAVDDDTEVLAGKEEANNFLNGAFRARSFYPGLPAHNNFFGEAISHIFNSRNSGSHDVFALDYRGSGSPIPRPIKVSANPYMARYILGLGLQRAQSEPDSDGKQRSILRLVVNPIIGIRNPFNVPILIRGGDPLTDGYGRQARVGMKLSLREYASTRFTFIVDGQNVANGKMTDFFSWEGTGYDGGETFIVFVPEIIIPPGETYVFSPSDRETLQWQRGAIIGEPEFNHLGGFYLSKLKNGSPLTLEDTTQVTLRMSYDSSNINDDHYNSGTFIREHIKSWPGDIIDAGGYHSSEHSEPFMINYSPNIVGRDYEATVNVSALPTEKQGSQPVGLAEFFEKPADWGVRGDGTTRIVANNNYPLYAMSNPITSTKRPDAQGRLGDKIGYQCTSPSWHFSIRKITSWEEALETSGRTIFSGNSMGSSGKTSFIAAYLPRSPLTSLGQFQTANISVADHFALYSVGNALPTPYVPADALYSTVRNWTNYDHTWLLNTALWDRYFFSTIAPEVNPQGSAAPAQIRPQNKVWSDFLSKNQPLLNTQFRLNPNSNVPEAQKLLEDKNAYRKSAAHLVQTGTFNIHSTDYRAWKTILGATHEVPVPSDSNTRIGGPDTKESPFPRVLPVRGNEFAKNNALSSESTWKSAKALTNAQIEKLARSIVSKIRARLATIAHEAPYTAPGGEKLVLPFFSLAQFINRGVSNDDPGKLGIVQAAIFHADKTHGAAINTGIAQPPNDLTRAKLNDEVQGAFPHPEVVEFSDGRIPIATGATGALLQGDIIQAIGPRLAARSDTFRIRTYGDATGKTGATHARAYLEAIVQRTPEYMENHDGQQPSDIAPENDPENRTLSPVNQYFGRRYRIVSIRWLSPNEI
ncbi:MAG: hypothetical protein LBD14_03450 [Puniceicoccales bacterium]|jgi:Tfp pilus assembly protein PilX|nr:hypothetical protein [Puniceicoccales bacterium]